jgi:hypothetical protein
MTLGEMVARISAQNSALKQTIGESKTLIQGFVSFVQDGRKKLRDWNDTVDQGATKLRNWGLAAGAAATGVTVFLSKLTTARSDAVETRNKFDEVFKHLASSTNQWVNQFSKDVGRARTDVRNWLADLQDTLVPLGFAREEAADMSKRLVELAVDVASFKNAADDEVIQAFTSALVGNNMAVRKYGIVITEAAMQAEAYRMGIKYSAQETDAATKAQIIYNMILRATADAHGDAVRNANEFANMQKRIEGRAKDLAETIGAGLMPIGKMIQRVILGVIDATERWILSNRGAAARVIALVVAITALLGAFALLATGGFVAAKVIVALGAVFSTLTSWPVLAVAAIAGLAWAWSNNFLGMRETVSDFWDGISPVITKILELEKKTISTLWDWTVLGLDWISLTFIPFLAGLPETLQNTWTWVVNGLAELREAAALAVERTVAWFVDLRQRWAERVAGWEQKVSDWFVNLRQRWETTVNEWKTKAVNMVVNLVQRWASTVAEWPRKAVNFAANLRQRWARTVDEWTTKAVNMAVNLVQRWTRTVDEWASKTAGMIVNLVQRWASTVDEWATKAVDLVVDLVQRWASTVAEWPAKVVNFAANLRQRWTDTVDEWTTKVVDFAANLRQRWAETVDEWTAKVVDFAVNLRQRWAERVDEWQDRVVDFTVNLRQRWTETVEGWKERVVEWQVKLREAADAVSATVQVWLDNAKDGVTWVVNLVKGAALDLVEWIGDKVDIIANIVRVTAEKASAGAQWLLNLIEGRAHAEELETTVDVVVDANPTPKVGLGTKLDNWLRNFFEGLQWVEISKEEFDKATEELGEKAVEMLKTEGDRYFMRSSEKLNMVVDFVLSIGTMLVGRAIYDSLKSAVTALWGLVGGWRVFSVALLAAVGWTLTPQPIKDALAQSLKGLGIEIGEDNQWIVQVTGIALSVMTWKFIGQSLLAALVGYLKRLSGVTAASMSTVGLILTIAAWVTLSIGWLLKPRPGAELADQMAELEQRMRWLEQQIEIAVDSEQLERLRQALDETKASYDALAENARRSALEVNYRLQQVYPGATVEGIIAQVREQAHELLYGTEETELKKQLSLLQTIARQIEEEGGIVPRALHELVSLWPQVQGSARAARLEAVPEDQRPEAQIRRWAERATAELEGSTESLSMSIDALASVIDRVAGVTGVPAELLSAIAVAEGFPEKARFGVLPEGMSDEFKRNAEELTRLLFGEGYGLQSDEFQATAAALSAKGYFERFKEHFKLERDLTFAELALETQAKFIEFMQAGYAPIGAENDPKGLNKNWKNNVLSTWDEIRDAMAKYGYDSIAEFVKGVQEGQHDFGAVLGESTLKFLAAAHLVYDEIENDLMAQRWGSDLSEHLVDGIEQGLEEGLPQVQGALAKVKETLLAGWDKLPAWIREPVQNLIDLVEAKLLPLVQMVETALAEMEGSAEELKRIADEAKALADGIKEDNPLSAMAQMVEGLTAGFGQGLQEAQGFATVVGSFFSKLKIDLDSIGEKGLRLRDIFGGWKQALIGVASEGLSALGRAISGLLTGYKVAGDKYGTPAQLAIGEMVQRFHEWDENARRLEDLRKQQAGYTVGGAVAGGIIGGLLSFALGPLGWLIGAGVGAAVGHQAGQATFGDQIAELEEKLQTTRESIKEILKITISDFASGLQQAFDSIDVKSFGRNFGKFIDETIRNAMIAAFIGSKAIQERLEALSNFIFDRLASGELAADAIARAREMGKEIVETARPFFETIKELFPGVGSAAGDSTSAGTVVTHVSGKLRDQLLDIFRPVSSLAQRLPGYVERMPSLLERIANASVDIRDMMRSAVIPTLQASAAGAGGIVINIYDAQFSESYTMKHALDDIAEYLGREIASTSQSRGVR